jgi:CubicO group peptidase (beta-lactamase class C family)
MFAMRLSAVVAAFGLLCAVGGTAAAAPRDDAIRAAVEEMRASAAVPALGLAVIDRGQIVFEGGFGQVGERPATEHDRFRAASISKLFTAQAVMKLAEAGRLSLDDDLARWLPAFQGRGLTLRHLLVHRSGLRDRVYPLDIEDPVRLEAYIAVVAAQTPAGAPGAAYGYTDVDYNLLGAVVAKASGRPFTDFVQTELFDPLTLSESTPFPVKSNRAGIASPFLNKPTVRPATPRLYDIAFAPSEGLVTSAHDLAVWTRATLRRDRRLLSRTAFVAMMEPTAEGPGPGRHAGLGWQLREEGGRRIAEHGGSVRGYNALVLTYPDQRRAIIVLTNADDAPRWEIAGKVDAILSDHAR